MTAPPLTVELIELSTAPGLEAGEAAAGVGELIEREVGPLRGRRMVLAEEGAIGEALAQAVAGGPVVVVDDESGGPALRQALARRLGVRLVLSDRALEALTSARAARGRALPRRLEALALVPQGAAVVVSPPGGALGFLVELGGIPLAVVPPGPLAAAGLIREHLRPRLQGGGGEVALVRVLRLVGLDRDVAEARLGEALGSGGPVSGHVHDRGDELLARLLARCETPTAAAAALATVEPALRRAFGAAWYGDGDDRLESVVGRLLRARGLTLALAESCTGGLVGHRLTEVAGSSAYVERGFLVYSNRAKEMVLGVPAAILREHGAVSAPSVRAMAEGARAAASTDLGLAVTGIAGPDGGTPVKPIGTVFIALAHAAGTVVEHHVFDRDRSGNKALSATRALDLLRRHCLDLP